MDDQDLPPDTAPIRPGSIPDGFFPENHAPIDEASRYMHERSTERLERRMSEDPPIPDASAKPPPFRRSRLRRYTALLQAKAAALIERGSVDIVTNGAPLHVRLVMFADGTGVVEYEHTAPYGSNSGMSRIDRDRLTLEYAAFYLEHALLNSRVRPIAGQEI